MKEYINKLKTFFYASLTLSSLCVILRTISILTSFEHDQNYYYTEAWLPYVHRSLMLVSIVFFACAFFFFPKCSLPKFCQFGLLSDVCASASCGFVTIISAIMLYLTMRPSMNILSYAIIISAILASVFFVIEAFTSSSRLLTAKILLAMCVAASLLLMIVKEYMNYFEEINSPNKVLFFISFAAFAVFIVQSIKLKINSASPKFFIFSAFSSTLLCGASAIPGIVGHYANILDNSTFLIYYFMNLAFAAYSLIKTYSYIKFVSLIPSELPEEDSPSEGSDEESDNECSEA